MICLSCEQEITNKKRKYCDSKCKRRMARLMQLERLKEEYSRKPIKRKAIRRKRIRTLMNILPLVHEEPKFKTIIVKSGIK